MIDVTRAKFTVALIKEAGNFARCVNIGIGRNRRHFVVWFRLLVVCENHSSQHSAHINAQLHFVTDFDPQSLIFAWNDTFPGCQSVKRVIFTQIDLFLLISVHVHNACFLACIAIYLYLASTELVSWSDIITLTGVSDLFLEHLIA